MGFNEGAILTTSNPAGGASAWNVQYTEPFSLLQPCEYHAGCSGIITALYCPSSTLCVAVNANGDVLSSTNPTGGAGAWQATQGDPTCRNGFSSCSRGGVSCPSASLCVISDGHNLLGSTSPASGPWNITTSFPQGAPAIFAGSCPTTELCIGALGSGLLLSTNPAGGPWAPVHVDQRVFFQPVQVRGVSCPSASFCAAIDNHGDAIVGNSTSAG